MMKTTLYALLATAVLLGGCAKKEEPQPMENAAPAPAAATDVQELFNKNGCLACHAVDKKLVGPAYSWVAYRSKDDQDAASKLAASIRNGSTGRWAEYTGGVAMPPHPELSDGDIQAMVKWILDRPPMPPTKS